MTVLDDEFLATLFGRAGASFEVPGTGPADILEKALASSGPAAPPEGAAGGEAGEAGEATPGAATPRRLTQVYRAHRVLSVAACVVVVLLLVAGGVGLLGRSSPPSRTTLGSPVIGRLPGHGASSPTTTTPPVAESAPSTGSGASGDYATAQGAAASGALNAPVAAGSPAVPVPTTVPSSLPPGDLGQSAKIEQTGSLSLSVGRGDLSKTMTQLSLLAGSFNGFVANSETESGAITADGAPNGSITLQVPVDSFAQVLKAAQALGRTTSLTTKATDVTGQYVDLQAQITSLQASRQQYLIIMTKATSVGDVLAVQSQLDSIESQIEQLQGQLQLLTSQTAYSTLNISVTEGLPPVHHTTPHHESGVAKAWHNSVRGFVDGVEWLIRIAGPLLFALLCIGAVLLGGRLAWRRYQRHIL
jgi:hypothetical protein